MIRYFSCPSGKGNMRLTGHPAYGTVVLALLAGSACSTAEEPVGAQATAVHDSTSRMVPAVPLGTGESTVATFPEAGEHAAAALAHTIIDAPNGTFGYDILSDGALLIHQVNMPGQPGNEGCRTREDAEKLAVFVIGKIKKGEMPPTVTEAELKELGLNP